MAVDLPGPTGRDNLVSEWENFFGDDESLPDVTAELKQSLFPTLVKQSSTT